MGERPIRILLVDDHTLFRQGLRQLLETTEDLLVVGEAGSGNEALALVETLAPDVVLMDIAMPDLDGIAATAVLHERFPNVRVVMLTMYDATTHGEAARAAGASTYVSKNSRAEELLQAIRVAANNAKTATVLLRPLAQVRLDHDIGTQEERSNQLERGPVQSVPHRLADPGEASDVQAGRTSSQASQAAQSRSEHATPDEAARHHATPRHDLRLPAPSSTVVKQADHPIALASQRGRRSPLPTGTLATLDTRHAGIWALIGLLVTGEALALASVLGFVPLPGGDRWVTLFAGNLASLALVGLVAATPHLRKEAQLLLAIAVSAATAWSRLAALHAPIQLQLSALASASLVALTAATLAWRRADVLATGFALAVLGILPAVWSFFPVLLLAVWGTGIVLLAAGLAWSGLQRSDHSVAWEWLPLAPLVPTLPALASSPAALPRTILPWLAYAPLLVRAQWEGRRGLPALVALTTGLAFGATSWSLRSASATTQAIGLTAFALGSAVLALLLRCAAQNRGTSLQPATIVGGFAVAAFTLAVGRHPESTLAPLAWSALAVALLAIDSRTIWRWTAVGLLVAASIAAAVTLHQPTTPIRFGILLAALTASTAGGFLLVHRPWWYPLAWLSTGTIALSAILIERLSGNSEIAAVSLLALGAVGLARLRSVRDGTTNQLWFWLPAAVAGLLALARALTGPLSPARLGLTLEPAIPATSEPVIAASILTAAALVAGRLLGRRWRWAAIATALLLVDYTLPAVIPDAALVVSWLALAIALAHAVGGRPWR